MGFHIKTPRLFLAAVLGVCTFFVAFAAYSVSTPAACEQLASSEARLTLASHGRPIDPSQCGVRRYYTEFAANGGTGWQRAVNNALVTIDCGDGNPRSAHLVRGSSGAVRVFTSWHGIYNVMSLQRQEMSATCRVVMANQTLSSCTLRFAGSGTQENATALYQRYRYHHERNEFAEAFRVAASDYASFALQCSADTEGQRQLAQFNSAALPSCGTTAAALPGLPNASGGYVSAGVIRDECSAGRARRVMSRTGAWDAVLSARYNACLFSNYTDVGMSGGMLAAVTGPNSACAVCIINSEVPGAVSRGGVPDMSANSHNFILGEAQNSGAFHPAF